MKKLLTPILFALTLGLSLDAQAKRIADDVYDDGDVNSLAERATATAIHGRISAQQFFGHRSAL